MLVGNYLNLVNTIEKEMAKAYKLIAGKHGDEPDVYENCILLASWCERNQTTLQPFLEKYPNKPEVSTDRHERILFDKPEKGSFALLRDLHDLWILTYEADICWTILLQAADGLRDRELKAMCLELQFTTKRQLSWLQTRVKQAAPQTLIVDNTSVYV